MTPSSKASTPLASNGNSVTTVTAQPESRCVRPAPAVCGGRLGQRFDGVEHAEHARRIAGVNHVEVNVADAPIVEDEPADLGNADGQRAAVPHGRVAERGTEDGEGGELEAHRARSLA